MSSPISRYNIDLDIISKNVRNIKSFVQPAKLLVVVKADAYGHGIVPVTSTAIKSGADYIGVSNLEEGVLLRQNGVRTPILLLNHILPEQAKDVVLFDLIPTISSLDVVQALNEEAIKSKNKIKVHIKIDTGFGRFGISPEHTLDFVRIIKTNFEYIDIEGIYTHFFSAENEIASRDQYNKFQSVTDSIQTSGYSIPLKHVCNSIAVTKYPDMHLDMVRVGNLIYGFGSTKEFEIENPGKIMSKVISIKTLPPRHGIGYGSRYKTKKITQVAVIPFGYYDGLELVISQPNGIVDGIKAFLKQLLYYFGFLGGKGRKVKIRGTYCHIIGKIGMQNCMVDLSPLKGDAIIGDDVEFFPRKINLRYDLPRVYHQAGRSYVDTRSPFPQETSKKKADFKTRGQTSIG